VLPFSRVVGSKFRRDRHAADAELSCRRCFLRYEATPRLPLPSDAAIMSLELSHEASRHATPFAATIGHAMMPHCRYDIPLLLRYRLRCRHG